MPDEINLKFDRSKTGIPIIFVDDDTKFSLGNAWLDASKGNWNSLRFSGIEKMIYNERVITERITDLCYLTKIHFSNKVKRICREEILKHVSKAVKGVTNDKGVITEDKLEDLKNMVEKPIVLEKKKRERKMREMKGKKKQ